MCCWLSSGSNKYAVVGGAACALLGSTRGTEGVDFVVSKGNTSAAKQLLKNQTAQFEVEKRTLYTHYKGHPPIEIEILAPPGLSKEAFDESTPTVDIQGVQILSPPLILNAKCQSILGRATEEKKKTDAQDIVFLLGWLAQMQTRPTPQEVPNASKAFVTWFVNKYQGQSGWTNVGYNMDTGKFAVMPRYNSRLIKLLNRELLGILCEGLQSTAKGLVAGSCAANFNCSPYHNSR